MSDSTGVCICRASRFLITVFVLLLAFTACTQDEPVVETVTESVDTLHFLVPCDSIGVELGDSTLMFGNI